MAIISNFELLVKPIAPPAGPASEIGRVVVQGYFLEISNLESRDIKLIFRTRTSVKQAGDGINTEFVSSTVSPVPPNNVVVYDITQDNNLTTNMTLAGQQIPGKQWGHYVNCLFLPAGQTASLAILPNVQALLAGPADLAIRGYTELVLSSDIDGVSPLTFSSPESARILVSPEHRGTFIDPQFDPTNFGTQLGLDFDQLAYSLPTANGKALQEINTHANFNDPFQDYLTSDFLSVSRVARSSVSLSEMSKYLDANTNAPRRTTSFKIGSVPVHIAYTIEKGKYKVEEKGVQKAVNLLIRRKRVAKKSVPSIKSLVKLINAALGGSKKADAQLQKIFEGLKDKRLS